MIEKISKPFIKELSVYGSFRALTTVVYKKQTTKYFDVTIMHEFVKFGDYKL